MNLTTENAFKFMGCTIYVKWLGNTVKRILIGQWPDGNYYYMYEDGATCCPIPRPEYKGPPLEMVRIVKDEGLKIHVGKVTKPGPRTLRELDEYENDCNSGDGDNGLFAL